MLSPNVYYFEYDLSIGSVLRRATRLDVNNFSYQRSYILRDEGAQPIVVWISRYEAC